MANVKDKKCVECKIKIPIYNTPGSKISMYCSDCKREGMINVKHKRCAQCKIKQPSYNTPGNKIAMYCNDCKLEGMVDVIHKRCRSEWCDTRSEKKYDYYCSHCYVHLFPDKPNSRNYKTKEIHVRDFIKKEFPDIDIVSDKRIDGGCSRRRPDIYIDLGLQIVIVEIDENQHVQYDCSCENKRLMELSRDVDHRSIVFIRFNPDEYCIGDDKISSCWSNSGNIKKNKTKEWNDRLSGLKETLTYWLNHTTDKTIEVIQLYYDE
jgi:hypothetical protein